MRLYQYNEDNFRFKFLIFVIFQQKEYTNTWKQREAVNFKSFSEVTFKLVIRNSCITIKTQIKSRLHYIVIIAYKTGLIFYVLKSSRNSLFEMNEYY